MPSPKRRSVSVVIPVRNEEESIEGLLDSLGAQTRRPDEVIICDGGSTDGTVGIIEHYAVRVPRIRLVRAGPALPGRARNVAIEAARSDLIVLTDAGTSLEPTWVENLVAPFDDPHPPDVVYGRFEPFTGSFVQRCIALAFVPPKDRSSGLRCRSVASMAMRRAVWSGVGGFREDLRSAEDLLFIRRAATLGFSTGYAQDAVVSWAPPARLGAAFRRFSAYSHSNIRAGLAREWQYPLLRVYFLMAVLTLSARWTALGWLAPLAVLGARAARRVARESGIVSLTNIPLLAGVMAALLTIDLATLEGVRRWLRSDYLTNVRRRWSVDSAG